jgi:hypothetical protein
VSGRRSAVPPPRDDEEHEDELEELDEQHQDEPEEAEEEYEDGRLRRGRGRSPVSSKVVYGLGIASLVLGIGAFVLSLVPCVGIVGLPIAAVGLLLGLVGGIIAIEQKRSGIGFPIAGSATSVLALLVGGIWLALGYGLANRPQKDQKAAQTVSPLSPVDTGRSVRGAPSSAASPPSSKARDLPPSEPEWADASKQAAQQGEVRVRVSGVRIDLVALKGLTGNRTSKDKLLQIDLTIDNLSATKLVHLRGWGGAEFEGFPSLQDNFKNSYRKVSFGIFDRPVGQVERNDDIYPGKSITDVLIFDVPVQGIQYLRLSLPAENFDEEAELRFQIPATMIRQ